MCESWRFGPRAGRPRRRALAALIPDDNPTGILLSAGDLEEGIAAFLTLSAGPGEEGAVSAFDRFESFKEGFVDGTAACDL